jgi:hypothetical protein
VTWTGKFTVQDVGDGPAPIDVLAAAQTEDIVSNTEGKIRSIELRIQLDEGETKVKIGDQFSISGHFTG